ncbi:MAG: septum formation initiator family protein [Pseudomonadota bacterium]
MDRLFHYQNSLKHNLFILIGVALCIYFAYHIVYGERSITKWLMLSHKIETVSNMHDNLKDERTMLEKKVVMMRPGSINKDLLEERVRVVLGYKDTDEHIILSN